MWSSLTLGLRCRRLQVSWLTAHSFLAVPSASGLPEAQILRRAVCRASKIRHGHVPDKFGIAHPHPSTKRRHPRLAPNRRACPEAPSAWPPHLRPLPEFCGSIQVPLRRGNCCARSPSSCGVTQSLLLHQLLELG